jgi:hypothetical protein
MGLAIVIWMWLRGHAYKYTLAVAMLTLWAIAASKAMGL